MIDTSLFLVLSTSAVNIKELLGVRQEKNTVGTTGRPSASPHKLRFITIRFVRSTRKLLLSLLWC